MLPFGNPACLQPINDHLYQAASCRSRIDAGDARRRRGRRTLADFYSGAGPDKSVTVDYIASLLYGGDRNV